MERKSTFGGLAPSSANCDRVPSITVSEHPSTRSLSPTPTLNDNDDENDRRSGKGGQLSTLHNGNSRSTVSVDSIWNMHYPELLEQRRREDEAEDAEHPEPYMRLGLGNGFATETAPTRHTGGGHNLGHGHSSKRSIFHSRSQSRVNVSSRANSHGLSRATTRATGAGANSRQVSRVPSRADGGVEEKGAMDFPEGPKGFWGHLHHNRRVMRKIMRLKKFHLLMIALVGIDLMIVMIELILGKSSLGSCHITFADLSTLAALLTASCPTEDLYSWLENALETSHSEIKPSDFACTLAPSAAREAVETTIFSLNLSLLCVFTMEVFSAIYAFGPITYCSSWVSVLDGAVVLITLCLDTYFHLSKSPAAKSPIALVILRLWKIFRAVHAIAHALEMHYEEGKSLVEASEAGREKLEWERIAESVRLSYVRRALIKASGEDVDPVLVEEEVEREVAVIKEQREHDEAQLLHDEEAEPECIGKGRQWVNKVFKRKNAGPPKSQSQESVNSMDPGTHT
ncbi:hypothetical protein P7C70_g6973, partial [Phenoliferia sp. Uapishka_3]